MPDAGIVLCGGRSSRMGQPKALLDWKGKPMVAHVVSILKQAVDEVVVVSSPDLKLPPLDARVIVDKQPGLGPLAGLHGGLGAIRSELAFVTAVDFPFLTPTFVRAMLAYRATSVVILGKIPQPLGAVYAKLLEPAAAALLATGHRSLQDLLVTIPYRRIRPEDLPDPQSLRGLNTPEDYRAALDEVH